MLALDVLYIAISTICIMVLLQVVTFVGVKLLYPPEPTIIYRDRVVDAPPAQSAQQYIHQPPATQIYLPQVAPQVASQLAPQLAPQVAPPANGPPQLPAHLRPIKTREEKNGTNVGEEQEATYEPRNTTTTSARMDAQFPSGLQETNPRDL